MERLRIGRHAARDVDRFAAGGLNGHRASGRTDGQHWKRALGQKQGWYPEVLIPRIGYCMKMNVKLRAENDH